MSARRKRVGGGRTNLSTPPLQRPRTSAGRLSNRSNASRLSTPTKLPSVSPRKRKKTPTPRKASSASPRRRRRGSGNNASRKREKLQDMLATSVSLPAVFKELAEINASKGMTDVVLLPDEDDWALAVEAAGGSEEMAREMWHLVEEEQKGSSQDEAISNFVEFFDALRELYAPTVKREEKTPEQRRAERQTRLLERLVANLRDSGKGGGSVAKAFDEIKQTSRSDDDAIDYIEFVNAMRALGTTGTGSVTDFTTDELWSVFQSFDGDGSGTIARDEWVSKISDTFSSLGGDGATTKKKFNPFARIKKSTEKTKGEKALQDLADKYVLKGNVATRHELRYIVGHRQVMDEELLDEIAQHVGYELKPEVLREACAALDVDGDAQVTFEEFYHFLFPVQHQSTQKVVIRDPSYRAGAAMKVDADTAVAVLRESLLSRIGSDNLREAFAQFKAKSGDIEAGHDNHISFEAFKRALGKVSVRMEPEHCRLLFNSIDVDGSGHISFDEFSDQIIHGHGGMSREVDGHATLQDVGASHDKDVHNGIKGDLDWILARLENLEDEDGGAQRLLASAEAVQSKAKQSMKTGKGKAPLGTDADLDKTSGDGADVMLSFHQFKAAMTSKGAGIVERSGMSSGGHTDRDRRLRKLFDANLTIPKDGSRQMYINYTNFVKGIGRAAVVERRRKQEQVFRRHLEERWGKAHHAHVSSGAPPAKNLGLFDGYNRAAVRVQNVVRGKQARKRVGALNLANERQLEPVKKALAAQQAEVRAKANEARRKKALKSVVVPKVDMHGMMCGHDAHAVELEARMHDVDTHGWDKVKRAAHQHRLHINDPHVHIGVLGKSTLPSNPLAAGPDVLSHTDVRKTKIALSRWKAKRNERMGMHKYSCKHGDAMNKLRNDPVMAKRTAAKVFRHIREYMTVRQMNFKKAYMLANTNRADGVTYPEFQGMLKLLHLDTVVTPTESKMAFDIIDGDGSGEVEYNEFVMMLAPGDKRSRARETEMMGAAALVSNKALASTTTISGGSRVLSKAGGFHTTGKDGEGGSKNGEEKDMTAVEMWEKEHPKKIVYTTQQKAKARSRLFELKRIVGDKLLQKKAGSGVSGARQDARCFWNIYQEMDYNGDGVVSYDEFRQALGPECLNLGLSEEDLTDIITACDEDGDGHIECDEFLRTMLNADAAGESDPLIDNRSIEVAALMKEMKDEHGRLNEDQEVLLSADQRATSMTLQRYAVQEANEIRAEQQQQQQQAGANNNISNNNNNNNREGSARSRTGTWSIGKDLDFSGGDSGRQRRPGSKMSRPKTSSGRVMTMAERARADEFEKKKARARQRQAGKRAAARRRVGELRRYQQMSGRSGGLSPKHDWWRKAQRQQRELTRHEGGIGSTTSGGTYQSVQERRMTQNKRRNLEMLATSFSLGNGGRSGSGSGGQGFRGTSDPYFKAAKVLVRGRTATSMPAQRSAASPETSGGRGNPNWAHDMQVARKNKKLLRQRTARTKLARHTQRINHYVRDGETHHAQQERNRLRGKVEQRVRYLNALQEREDLFFRQRMGNKGGCKSEKATMHRMGSMKHVGVYHAPQHYSKMAKLGAR